jgi:hypothetical protein
MKPIRMNTSPRPNRRIAIGPPIAPRNIVSMVIAIIATPRNKKEG